jgi:hypothetical protein
MATEGAGGLSTTAIERCIDNWADETQDGDEIPAARAELAALVEAAGYGAGLTAALIGAEYILTCLLGAGEFLVPRTPERCYRVMIGQDQHKSALRALRAARDALAGRGAAGARDEIERKAAAWDWAWEQSRSDTHPTWFDERGLLGNALAAVDARRAGGAGETDKEG